jgi:hypothetical protein
MHCKTLGAQKWYCNGFTPTVVYKAMRKLKLAKQGAGKSTNKQQYQPPRNESHDRYTGHLAQQTTTTMQLSR